VRYIVDHCLIGVKEMDAFENIVAQLLIEDDFWVMTSVRVDLTKEEKKEINKPTTPRPEIDIIAFNLKNNTLFLIEVKSFFDSRGVVFSELQKKSDIQKGRYKLLTSDKYRNIISKRLFEDLNKKGLINTKTKISYGLIAGNVYQNKESEIKEYFNSKKWLFWGPSEIKSKVIKLSSKGYENNPVTIASKIILRD